MAMAGAGSTRLWFARPQRPPPSRLSSATESPIGTISVISDPSAADTKRLMTIEAGFSFPRLERIRGFLQTEYIDSGKLPCAQVRVSRGGRSIWDCSLGRMDVERDRPLTPDTIFRIYSMTKPLTTVAFMMLVERGLVALDDPVERYLPAFKDLAVFAGGVRGAFRTRPLQRPMQVIDLLRHTSGLTYGFQQRSSVDAAYRELRVAERPDLTLTDFVDELATLPLEFSPGTAWNYSVSTDVVGHLVAVISGQPFDAFLRQHLLDPLGMVDTAFEVPPDKAARLAACYAWRNGGGFRLIDDPVKSRLLEPAIFHSGGGGLVSTLNDYDRFCHMLRNRGELDGHRYLSRKTLDLMWSNHLPGDRDLPDVSVSMFAEAIYNGIGFGLGFAVVRDPAKTLIPGSVGEVSWGGLASTAFWVDPAEDLSVVFLTQLIPSSTYPIRRQLRTMVYAALVD